ncbi:MAG: VOC family protein [Alphaproteobacteria bacterium]|jgi:catechol 2,3-dioxygenase-like lactoylglutathione lyase family enzyme
MARGNIDLAGLDSPDAKAIRDVAPPADMPFAIRKIGHVVLKVADIDRSVEFYTQVLGFHVTDVYPESMMPGRMVFLRFSPDHHGVALVGGGGPSSHSEMHHMAFAVDTLDEVFRAREHFEKHGVPIDFEGRRRAGCQVSLEFRDPDGHNLEIYWGLDQVPLDGIARPPGEWTPTPSLEEALQTTPPGQDTALADPGLIRKPN